MKRKQYNTISKCKTLYRKQIQDASKSRETYKLQTFYIRNNLKLVKFVVHRQVETTDSTASTGTAS